SPICLASARQRFMHKSETKAAAVRRNLQDRLQLRFEVRETDREAVRSIVERTDFFRPDEIDVAVELVDERLKRGVASGYHFVFAEASGQLVGYSCFGPIACALASFDLYWIAVVPASQGQGLGRLVMNAVERQIAAAGGRRIYIDTSGQPKYAPTRSFYERTGFRCEARLVDFYAAGDDRLIFSKAVAANGAV
ncbi:MAG TPA: GNAT family N-acetyltransferase, partial [Lacipirellulaceae bacterium]|nr:GNAT family N-acetyltransferase [Lacipirellulaceae bacterium]